MNISIRLEAPKDHFEVENLTREAFWKTIWGTKAEEICEEHLLVHRIRNCESYVPELNFIAEVDGKLVGHIIYTKSEIVDPLGNRHETLTFGPLSVLPEYQGLGIGKALMMHTFQEAKRLGYRAVIIFGHPDYYPRVGFKRASDFGICTADGSVRDSFMVLPLYDNALEGVSGIYACDTVFETLTQEDAREFDKRFPTKERHTPVPINAVLERLVPNAKEAIKQLDCLTLSLLSTKSERELSLLEGIDEAAIETINTVMNEHGIKWGESKKDIASH